VEFQYVNHFFDSFYDALCFGFHIFYVRNHFHNVHQQQFVLDIIFIHGISDDALYRFLDELFEVFQSGFELHGQKRCEDVNPGQDFVVQRVLQGLKVELEPRDLYWSIDFVNFGLDVL
jgi:hypothetical protein